AIKASLLCNMELVDGLINFGLSRESRLARLMPIDMALELLQGPNEKAELIVEFSLSKGSFATSILREMIDFR
ncbi:tRNA pseudouridine(13) synthase TruD, partial [Marinomonas arenicola]